MARTKRRKRARRRRLNKWYNSAGRSKFTRYAKSKAKGEIKRIKGIVKEANPEHILQEVPVVKDIIKPITEFRKVVEDIPDPIKKAAENIIEHTPVVKDIAKPLMKVFNVLF